MAKPTSIVPSSNSISKMMASVESGQIRSDPTPHSVPEVVCVHCVNVPAAISSDRT